MQKIIRLEMERRMAQKQYKDAYDSKPASKKV